MKKFRGPVFRQGLFQQQRRAAHLDLHEAGSGLSRVEELDHLERLGRRADLQVNTKTKQKI
jgi:hypothetical protein